MKKIFLLLTIVFCSIFSHAQTADIILHHGKIFTSDEKGLFVEAVAIKGNRILATGSDETIEKLTGNDTQKIDLRGKTVIPGINNAHFHLLTKLIIHSGKQFIKFCGSLKNYIVPVKE